MEYKDLYKQYRQDDDFAKFFKGLMDIGFRVLANMDEAGDGFIILIRDDECVEMKYFNGQVRVTHFKEIPKRWQKFLTKARMIRTNYKGIFYRFVSETMVHVCRSVHTQDGPTFEFWDEKFMDEQIELIYQNVMDYVRMIGKGKSPEEQEKYLTGEMCGDYLLTPDTEFFDVLYGQYTTNPFFNRTGYETESEFYQSLAGTD